MVCLRSAAAAILFRAVETGALSARDTDFFRDGFVTRHFFLDGLDHSALTTFGIARSDHLFGDDVIAAGFHLAGLSAVASRLAAAGAEHRAAGGEAEGNGGEGHEQE